MRDSESGVKYFTVLLLVISTVLVSSWANAEIYKWVDGNGKVHYGDRLPENVLPQEIGGDVNTVENQSYDFLPKNTEPAKEDVPVVMYATSWCPYCQKARNYFNNRGIRYTEYDIEKDEAAKKEYDALGGKGVPLIVIGDKVMSGFSAERFNSFYKG